MAGTVVVALGVAVGPAFSPPARAAATYSVTATITVGEEGSGGGIALDARTHRLYVPSAIDGKVDVVDTTTNSVVGSIAVGPQPTSVAIDTLPTVPVKGRPSRRRSCRPFCRRRRPSTWETKVTARFRSSTVRQTL
jgi:YVTN family beta-propeller protein